MKITLKKLTLRGFRGVVSESFEFIGRETFIHGRNKAGKTSLYDAFLWVNFGKDHLDRSDYQLKTRDLLGNTKPKTECEVEEVLDVDGKITTLRRVYGENWVKPKGEAEEVFKGNTTTYYINDVDVPKSEYDAFVLGLCGEKVFKSITNPHYFPSLSKDEQRALLFSMAGEITNESVAATNKAFQELLTEITGVSFDSFRKELAAKKRRIKEELAGIEPRIDELKRTMPEIPDLDAINKELEEKKGKIELVEMSISDIAKQSESVQKERLEWQGEINKLELENQQLGFEETQKQSQAIQEVKRKIDVVKSSNLEVENKEAQRKQKVVSLNKEKDEKLEIIAQYRKEYQNINAETLTFPEGAFECPTCKRLLEPSDIDAKQAELVANFNNEKARRIEENKKKGLAIKTRLDEIEKELEQLVVPVEAEKFTGTKLDILNEELVKVSQPIPLTEKQNENQGKINWFRSKLNEEVNLQGNQRFIEEKNQLQGEIDKLKERLALKDVVENTNTRIKQLEGQFKTLNQELAHLERKEFTLKEFEFAKNTEYEVRINQMFKYVKFKLFAQQVDGQIIPTCEAMIDGVLYSTLNNADQYKCGLDIINTISAYNDKYAPIWLDNREGVTEIPEMTAQVINLVVNPEKQKLTIV